MSCRMGDPLSTASGRFCWDWWHVPGQYTLLRTPADAFFPPELYDRLEDALIEYGEKVLGCRGISPIGSGGLGWGQQEAWEDVRTSVGQYRMCKLWWPNLRWPRQHPLPTHTPIPCSCYVNGCRQGLHADAPHGPFAFVLSLTQWEARRFIGGETVLLRPAVLDYWREFDSGVGTEMPQLVRKCWLAMWQACCAACGACCTCLVG